MENGTLKIFTTFGMIEIIVKDGQGNPLSLASGATATVSIPLGEIVGPNPPVMMTKSKLFCNAWNV